MDERLAELKAFIEEFEALQEKYNLEVISDDPFCGLAIKDLKGKKIIDFWELGK